MLSDLALSLDITFLRDLFSDNKCQSLGLIHGFEVAVLLDGEAHLSLPSFIASMFNQMSIESSLKVFELNIIDSISNDRRAHWVR